MKHTALWLMALSFPSADLAIANHFDLQLSRTLDLDELQILNPADYVYSEKLDGVRGYWDGKQLFTRRGNLIHAPESFISELPDFPVEGELWIGRGSFAKVSSIVRSTTGAESDWGSVKFYLFDLPHYPAVFSRRRAVLQEWIQEQGSSHLKLVEIHKIKSVENLTEALHQVQKQGGEGLMLHRTEALYAPKRSWDLLKLKGFQDAEAKVVGHTAGNGKYSGKLGALIVETADGIRFKIGSGLSDEERSSPPPIGSIITFRFNGYTAHGKPRFARFDRIRNTPD